MGASVVWRAAGVAVSVLLLSACAGPPQYDFEPLPRIEDYRPSEWDMDKYGEDLGVLAAESGIAHPPEVEIVRWLNPEERVDVMVACLRDKGVDARRTDDLGYRMTSPPGQEEQTNLARYVCSGQYPVRLDIARPPTGQEQRWLYDHLIRVWLPCAEDEGYSDLTRPSFDDYASALQQGTVDPVMVELHQSYSPDQWVAEELWEACPYWPEGYRQYETD